MHFKHKHEGVTIASQQMTLKNVLTVKRYHHATFNHALFICSRWSTFAGNSALLPSDIIDFAMLPAQQLLKGNSFVRCQNQ